MSTKKKKLKLTNQLFQKATNPIPETITMKNISIFIALIATLLVSAQENEKPVDTLTMDEIHVVKPYTPKVSDAFKIKENPSIEKEAVNKDTVPYSYYAAPVASTFTPIKGEAKQIIREPLDYVYENYVSVGYGNYNTPYAEALINSSTNERNNFGLYAGHLSSGGGIDEVKLDDSFSDTKAHLYYRQQNIENSWEVYAGTHLKARNWYGLPEQITFDQTVIDAIDPSQKFTNFYGGANIYLDEKFFESARFDINKFSDDYDSDELRISFIPDFEFKLNDHIIDVKLNIDYISGSFKEDYIGTSELEYGFTNFGITPSFQIEKEDYDVHIGLKAIYAIDNVNSNNQFYLYPDLMGSYKLLDENMIAFAGIVGGLTQNSYYSLSNQNPFISPTLDIKQTDLQFNTYIGIKGKLNNKFNYNTKIGYQNEKDRALYVLNPSLTNGIATVNRAYQAGNSFGVVYDDVDRFQFFAEVDYNLITPVDIGMKFEFNNYVSNNQAQAWNLPKIQSAIFAKYKTKKWHAYADLFYTGKRYDYYSNTVSTTGQEVEVDGFFDVNLSGTYILNQRMSAFVKVNNLIGGNYERFAHYPVQAFQIMGGVTYKFDL